MIRSLREAMTLSDFPLLLQDSQNKILQEAYRGVVSTWRQWCKIGDVSNFLLQHRLKISEAEELLLVDQLDEYKDSKLTEADRTYRVYKYGRKFGVSWETLINDDLQSIKDQPTRFGRAAARKIAAFAISLLEGTTPSSTVTTALGDSTLQAAINEMEARVDSLGNKLGCVPRYLIVPPAQQFTARKLLESTTIVIAGDTDRDVGTKNVLEGILDLCVDPFLTDANDWFLACAPNDIPGIEVGFLRGKQEPELSRKKQDWDPIASPYDIPEASFDNDAIEYRVRYVFGGARIDANGLLKVGVT